jgi:hypothetical protein
MLTADFREEYSQLNLTDDFNLVLDGLVAFVADHNLQIDGI